MIIPEKKLTYVYDFNLAKWYIENGEVPVSQGVGKFGDANLTFEVNDKITALWKRWQTNKPDWWYNLPANN